MELHIKNSVKKFHEICDNQSCTVTIVKVEDSDEILGGYNPIEWYEPFMNFHENEAVQPVLYDFVRFFMNFHENEAVQPVSYDFVRFFMKIHENEAVQPVSYDFVRFFMNFHEKIVRNRTKRSKRLTFMNFQIGRASCRER